MAIAFNIGDTVIRTGVDWADIRTGDTGIVSQTRSMLDGSQDIQLEGRRDWYSSIRFGMTQRAQVRGQGEFRIGDKFRVVQDTARTGQGGLIGTIQKICEIGEVEGKKQYFFGNGDWFLWIEDMSHLDTPRVSTSFREYLKNKEVLHGTV